MRCEPEVVTSVPNSGMPRGKKVAYLVLPLSLKDILKVNLCSVTVCLSLIRGVSSLINNY